MNIEIQHLQQFYGRKQVLFDINLHLETGMFGLLGRNGSGKSTLMKTLVGLQKKASGSITICGIPIEKAKEIREIIGYLPQDFSVYPNMTVKQVLDYLGVLSGMAKKELEQKSHGLLAQVNLLEHQYRKVKSLSGGMKRRLGIAQALLHNPKVVIVDEPTTGLDPEERIRFRNLLSEIAKDRIVILSTHIVGDIEATCEQIAILHEGHIQYRGTVQGLLHETDQKVFSAIIKASELEKFKSQYSVTSMLTQGQEVVVRFVSEKMPIISSKAVAPNLEDAYLYFIHRGERR